MWRIRAALLGAVLALAAPETFAQAPLPCGERVDIVGRLAQKFDEVEIGFGLTGKGALVELFVSPQGSWTVLLSLPSGVSCLLAAGQEWELRPLLTQTPDVGS